MINISGISAETRSAWELYVGYKLGLLYITP